jgi:hypothetical protein
VDSRAVSLPYPGCDKKRTSASQPFRASGYPDQCIRSLESGFRDAVVASGTIPSQQPFVIATM